MKELNIFLMDEDFDLLTEMGKVANLSITEFTSSMLAISCRMMKDLGMKITKNEEGEERLPCEP